MRKVTELCPKRSPISRAWLQSRAALIAPNLWKHLTAGWHGDAYCGPTITLDQAEVLKRLGRFETEEHHHLITKRLREPCLGSFDLGMKRVLASGTPVLIAGAALCAGLIIATISVEAMLPTAQLFLGQSTRCRALVVSKSYNMNR